VAKVPSRILPAVIKATGRDRPLSSAAKAREHVEELRIRPRPFGPPRRLRSDVSIGAERRGGWPIYTLTPKGTPSDGVFVYVHGGGWVNEIVSEHWRFAAQIAAEARLRVIVPIYPLVPFGTAVEVVPEVADLVAEQFGDAGAVSLGGDSSGGQIALSAATLLRDGHGHTLAATVLIAPILDLSLSNPAIDAVESHDPWLARPGIRVWAGEWRGELPVGDPRVSPLAADLAGLGPMTMFSGTRDILNPDARLLVQKASAAGVDVDYYEGAGLLHVFPLTPTPEGRAARTVVVDSLRRAHGRVTT
jgi:acetyl esterase/lipase